MFGMFNLSLFVESHKENWKINESISWACLFTESHKENWKFFEIVKLSDQFKLANLIKRIERGDLTVPAILYCWQNLIKRIESNIIFIPLLVFSDGMNLIKRIESISILHRLIEIQIIESHKENWKTLCYEQIQNRYFESHKENWKLDIYQH